MDRLLELRDEIDRIDREMVELFEKRMDVCAQVAEYKISVERKYLIRSGTGKDPDSDGNGQK